MLVSIPKSLRLFGAFLLLITTLFAQPIVDVETIENNTTTSIEDSEQIEDIEEKFIYLSFQELPQEIYKNQIFELHIDAIITKNKIEDVSSIFTGEEGIKILNPNSTWKKVEDNKFNNKYYIQALDNEIKIPSLIATFVLDKDVNIDEILDGFYKNTQPVMGSKDYSSVLAKSLEVKHYKTTRYDNTHNILVLEMESVNGNLYDFHIENSDIKSQGIDSSFVKMPSTSIVYYAVIPVHWKNFRFEYFNIDTLKFDTLEIPIVIDAENISTQSDLNPKNSPMEAYKNYAFILFAIILVVIALLKRSKVLGAISFVVVIVAIVLMLPYEESYIKDGSKVRLLPTKNSTIFYISDGREKVKVMKKIGDYYKIIFDNERIGWVNEKDIIKN
jgi:hypothetical protein